MGLAPPSSFLRRLLARPAPPVQEDPADMGTAFGLEASLGPWEEPEAGDANSPHAIQKRDEDDSPMGWLGRRTARPR